MFHETFKPLLDVSFSKSRQQVLPVGLVAAILIDVHIARVWIVILFAQKDLRVCSSWHTLNLINLAAAALTFAKLPFFDRCHCLPAWGIPQSLHNSYGCHGISQCPCCLSNSSFASTDTCKSGQLSKESDSSRISNIKSG